MKLGSEQMRRDGIKRLHAWGKPKPMLCGSYQIKNEMPVCRAECCKKKARYSTPDGNFCFTHTIERVLP